MGQLLSDYPYLLIAGLILFFSLFFMRGAVKVIWKIVRVLLILLALLLIAGYFLGYLDITFL